MVCAESSIHQTQNSKAIPSFISTFMQNNNYDILLQKIDAYIRKYYLNLLIKGILLSSGLLLAFILLVSVVESFAYMQMGLRATIFYVYLALAIGLLTWFILLPLLKVWKLSKRLDRKEAAKNIGEFFPELDDKLLNTLQLNELSDQDGVNANLLNAVIDQRSEELSVFKFQNAIQYSSNKRFLPFVLPIVLVFVVMLFAAPSLIKEPTERIINYDQVYEPEAPFSFKLLNDKLELIENEDFTIELQMKGDEIPSVVSLHINDQQYRLKKKDLTHFYYTFKNIRKPFRFHFKAEDFASAEYDLRVIPRPSVINFEIEADYPAYTGKQNESFKNIGDLVIPEGTQLKWKFETKDAIEINISSEQEVESLNALQKNYFEYEKRILEDMRYGISSGNELVKGLDTLYYQIKAVKDAYPLIRMSELRDSLQRKHIYIRGFIKDDYGFTGLRMKYRIIKTKTDEEPPAFHTRPLPYEKGQNQQQFFHFLDLNEFNIKAGQQLQYYFEVVDNDRVNGAKSSQSQMMTFAAPSTEELIQERNESTENIKDKMEDAIKKAAEIEKELERVRKELAQKNKIDWSDKEQIKNILKKNQELMKELENIKKENQEKLQKESEFKEIDESILEKQKQLQELMEKLLTPEMKKMMEEMQKMMEEQLKKEDAEKMLDQLELENEDINDQLERDLELFKEMDFQMKMQDAIDQLDSLQKQQEALQQETKDKSAPEEELQQKQEELNEQFEEFKEQMEEMREANEQLEEKHDLESTQEEEQGIQEQMQDAQEKLGKGQEKKASESQQNAQQQMQKLKDKLEQMQSGMEMEQTGEDMEVLREILDNLVQGSFTQEEIMKELKKTPKDDPRYPELLKEQKKLRDDMQGVEDSLMALSKRQMQIQPFVNKEISKINRNMDNTLADLQEMNTIGYVNPRQKNQVVASQQQIMTAMNQLALMLSEALDQMQKQMAQQQAKSNPNCKNPKPGKGGKPSAQSIKKMQENLKKQMEQMKKSMQGKPQGKDQNGKAGQQGEKMSEEMARLAAQQEMIRRKLQEYQEELKKDGYGEEAKALSKIAEQMEENETDLVNRVLTAESIRRQEEILSRLLEAEKAERERGEKEERKSKEAKNTEERNIEEFSDYKKLKSKEVELLKTIPLYLKPFYKNRVKLFFEEQLDSN
jgi:hypothetical protein